MRVLVDVELIDVAPVVDPAYMDTSSALRSLARAADADLGEVRRLAAEDSLRTLYGLEPHPQPMPHSPGRLLGARARERMLEMARDTVRGQG
jgi:uncharacterized protein